MADKKFNATSITTFYKKNNDFTEMQSVDLFNFLKNIKPQFKDINNYKDLKGSPKITFITALSSHYINETLITNTITSSFDTVFHIFCKCICSIKFSVVNPPTDGTELKDAIIKNTKLVIENDTKKFDKEIPDLIGKVVAENKEISIDVYKDIYKKLVYYIFDNISDILILMYTYDIDFKKKFTLISWILISYNNQTTESYREYINSAYESVQPANKLFAKCICKVYNFLINIYNESYYQYLIDLDPTALVHASGNGYDEFEGYGERKNKPNFQNLIKSYSTKYANKYNIKPKQLCEMFFSSLVTSMISNDDNNIDKINKKINNYLSDKNFNEEFDDYKLHLENNITRLESKCSNYSFYDSDKE